MVNHEIVCLRRMEYKAIKGLKREYYFLFNNFLENDDTCMKHIPNER